MKLIVGLGNPDKEYLNTFHNLGFMSVDKTAEMLGVEFKKEKCKALIAETKIGNEKIIIAKPLTYMNLSGESVRELLSFYKIDSHCASRKPTNTACSVTKIGRFTSIPSVASKRSCSSSVMVGNFSFKFSAL